MTELLYLRNSYLKEFRARVIKSISNGSNYVVLDKTAFYPTGGGQPSDTGFLEYDNNKVEVLEVTKKGEILHRTNSQIPEGTEILGKINWDSRYIYMRMHTAQHIVSKIILNEFKARTVGSQIHKEFSRMDFSPIKLSQQNISFIEQKANKVVKKALPVNTYEMKREEIEKTNEGRANLELIPRHINPLRVVEIQNFDICPCAGTHVKNTREVGKIRILKKENKGKERERVIFTID